MDRHAPAPTLECPSCGWPSGPTCAHCGHQRSGTADGHHAGQDTHPDAADGPSFADAFARSAARRRLDDTAEHSVTQWW